MRRAEQGEVIDDRRGADLRRHHQQDSVTDAEARGQPGDTADVEGHDQPGDQMLGLNVAVTVERGRCALRQQRHHAHRDRARQHYEEGGVERPAERPAEPGVENPDQRDQRPRRISPDAIAEIVHRGALFPLSSRHNAVDCVFRCSRQAHQKAGELFSQERQREGRRN